MLALIVLDFRFYSTQFLFDDNQTFVDELGGIDGYLVLVFDGFFVVDRNQHIQYIFGTNRRVVVKAEIQDGSIIFCLTDIQIRTE